LNDCQPAAKTLQKRSVHCQLSAAYAGSGPYSNP
jgi:hypothetical protein